MRDKIKPVLPFEEQISIYNTLQTTIYMFKTVFDSFEDALFIIDLQLHAAYLNPKAVEIAKAAYGINLKVGDSMIQAFPEYRQSALQMFYNRVLEGETLTYQFLTTTGVWLHCHYSPLFDTRGKVTAIFARVKDYTLQKQLEAAEQKARELEKTSQENYLLFEQFMKHSPLIGWITDKDGTYRYMNSTYLKTYNLSGKDATKSIYELFPDQIAVDYHMNNLKVIKSGKSIEFIEDARLPNGQEQVLKVYKFPIYLNGTALVAGWAVDITENIRLEKQLQESVERYDQVQEATSDAIYDWQMHSNKIYRGTGFKTLFGYAEQSVSIRTRLLSIHPDDRDRIKTIYFKALRDQLAQKWALEYQILCADGTYKFVIDKAVINRINGKAVRVLGALQDITEQKELQAKLLSLEKKAKRRVIKSIIEAQEKERRKLSVELHDNVNQMLASCKLMLEVACDGGELASDFTRRSYESVNGIISEIRRISHDLNPSALQDVGLVEAIIEMVDVINATGKVQIKFSHLGCIEKGSMLDTDLIAVFRIIQEQVNNILKHSRATQVSIILLRKENHFHVKIEDNGVGFDVERAKKGLGLRNIQNRVDYYNGSLKIHSLIGRGTQVAITLNIGK